MTIHNALVSHDAQVTTVVEGVAASAASIIAMAGKPAKIFENATMMIHRAQGGGFGNVGVMLEMADILKKIDESLAQTYVAKTGKTMAQVLKLMDGVIDGTWLTAKEAKAQGFSDEIVKINNQKPASASTTLSESVIAMAKREDSRRNDIAESHVRTVGEGRSKPWIAEPK